MYLVWCMKQSLAHLAYGIPACLTAHASWGWSVEKKSPKLFLNMEKTMVAMLIIVSSFLDTCKTKKVAINTCTEILAGLTLT